MDQRAFVRTRHTAWEHLELLVTRVARKGLRHLDAAEVFELGRLYRCATSDLSFATARRYDGSLLAYLNRLVARAHAQVYGGSVEGGAMRVVRFFRDVFPAEVRRSWPYVAVCAGLTVVWAMVAYALVMHNPASAYSLLPAQMVPDSITKALHDSNFGFGSQQSAMMSSMIITNNIKVSVLAFAGGIVTLGAGTLYVIILNGLMLGALGALYTQAGFGADFWATVAPHGFIELTAIQIAGGAGLLIAAGVLLPGRLPRRIAVRENGRRAGILIGGVAGMLCVAGIIEGFFSPLRFSQDVRAGVGIFTAIVLALYFSRATRAA